MTTFHVITLFPQSLDSYLSESILKRAQEDKKIRIKLYNPRDYTENQWHRVDRKPYGGGPGMVIEAQPVIKAIEKALGGTHGGAPAGRVGRGARATKKPLLIWLTPGGTQFTNGVAQKFAAGYTDIIIICGRYEGIDARVKKAFKGIVPIRELSVGPFVMTGGELGAMILIDCIARQLEGVLGNVGSLEESRAASHDVYTRPETFVHKGKKLSVPKILLSGDHARIEAWRAAKRAAKVKPAKGQGIGGAPTATTE